MEVKLLDSTVDPLFVISMCARTCYCSREKDTTSGREAFVKGLIRSGHESVLENAIATFDIKGISRSCLAQVTRHRIGVSFCVCSQRYVDMSEEDIVIPNSMLMAFPEVIDVMKGAKGIYHELVKLGVPREDARFLLPEGTTTTMTMTMNFRALRHFLKLRLSKRAQWEIRELAYRIYKICSEKWPWLIADFDFGGYHENN